MTTLQQKAIQEQAISTAREALQRVRALRNTRKLSGVDGICQHIENVEGDWLERWHDEDSNLPGAVPCQVKDTSSEMQGFLSINPALLNLLVLHVPYVVLGKSSALVSLSENSARIQAVRTLRRKDWSFEFPSKTQKHRHKGKTSVVLELQRLQAPRWTEER
jgi:hypothetical protein